MDFKDKREIRRYMLEKRNKLAEETRKVWDRQILRKLLQSDYYKNSMAIFTFVSFGAEVDTHKFIEIALKDGKTVAVPKIVSKERGMEVFAIRGFEDLNEGYYNILEPVEGCPKIDAEQIDLILMPGVAFDLNGGRIGYGGGFYDRFLKGIKKSVLKIALAYEIQLIEKIPMDYWDVRIDGIITNGRSTMFNMIND